MFNRNDPHFILKHSDGSVHDIYTHEKAGLCISLLGKKGIWQEPSVISRDYKGGFYACLDINDRMLVAFQDTTGGLKLASEKETGQFRVDKILTPKQPDDYKKQLFINSDGKKLFIYFTLRKNDDILLARQLVDEDAPKLPETVDIISAGNYYPLYTGLMHTDNDLLLFYKSASNEKSLSGFRLIKANGFEKTTFLSFEEEAAANYVLGAAEDNEGNIHICAQRKTIEGWKLIYMKKEYDETKWQKEQILYTAKYSFENAGIIIHNIRITIFWIWQDIIYCCFSKDDGQTWSRPERVVFYTGSQLVCIKYQSMYEEEKGIFEGSIFPGSFRDGYKLAFVNEDQRGSNRDELHSLKGIPLEIKTIRNNIKDLQENMLKMQKDIFNIGRKITDIEKEMIRQEQRHNKI